MKPDTSQKFFCPLPWTHRHIDTLGNVKACCMSEEANDFESERHISCFSSEIEVSASSHIQELRGDFRSGKIPATCQGCLKMEQMGLESARMRAVKEWGNPPIQETLAMGVKTLDLRFGNHCNLKCVMCSPFASRAWLEDWNGVSSDPLTPDTEESLKHLQWYKTPRFWKYLETVLPKIGHLHFAGGEPFMSQEMVRTLDLCVSLGISKKISVSYSTNLTISPEKFKGLWSKFRNVRLRVSLDGVGIVNQFIRYPSRWEKVDSLLKQLDKTSSDWNISEIEIWCTIQLYNIFHLRDLYLYLRAFDFVSKYPFLAPLTWPSYFSIQQLNNRQKRQVEEEIKSICDEFLDGSKKGLRDPIQLVAFMNSVPADRVMTKKFREVNKKIEKINKTKCIDVNPHLSPQLNRGFLNGIF